MEAIRIKNIKNPVILIKILQNNKIVVIDNETTIRYFDRNNIDNVSGFKVKIQHERYKTNVVSITDDGEYLGVLSADCRESILYNLKTKKAIAKVSRHQGEVSCIGIDPANRYMFSCGEDGKIFAIDIKSGKLVFTLPVHVDTVNDIAFSANSNWVVTASYDRKVSPFNLATMSPRDKLKAHAAPVMKQLFISHNKFVSVDKNSTAIVWNVYSGKIIARLQGIHDDVTQMAVDSKQQFLFLSTMLGYILLYDAQTYKLLSRKYIKLSSQITALAFDDEKNELIVGTESGDILFYNIYQGEDKLKELLANKEFTAIQKEAEVNPTLAYTHIYDVVANLWETTLKKAKIALQKNDKKTAILLFKSFKNIPEKNKIMQKVMLEYAEFEKFTALAKAGKIQLAYNLANTHPLYKESGIYKALEKNWKKAFAQAQKYALQPKGTESAKQVLAPYRGLSEKTKLIQELLTKGETYKRFRAAMGQKDFRICFELIKQNPYLQEFPEYGVLMNYADSLYIKAQEFINNGDTHNAIKMLRVLQNFTDFADEVKILMKDIENKQKFFNAIEDDDTALAYNMLAETEELLETKDGKKLHEQWNSDVSLANEQAVEGNTIGIKNILAPYMKISSKYASIATIFGWAYMVQLENAIKAKKDKVEIENGIKNYILSFGLQDQIENLYMIFKKRYPNSKLNLEFLTHGSMKMWRPSMIVDSILD